MLSSSFGVHAAWRGAIARSAASRRLKHAGDLARNLRRLNGALLLWTRQVRLPPAAAQANACVMTRVGFFSGSFDPMTNGHLDVIEHAAALCDRLVIGVGSNPNKAALFTVKERLKLIYEAAAPIMAKVGCELDVVEFTGLAIEAARKAGATLIFRGLRDGTDFDYEMQMAGMNGAMAPELRTVFLPASSPVRPITATLVRQIASMGGDASAFAPPNVIKALKAKFAKSS
jgi:pantetheine-phosphate adenylyltransferase